MGVLNPGEDEQVMWEGRALRGRSHKDQACVHTTGRVQVECKAEDTDFGQQPPCTVLRQER